MTLQEKIQKKADEYGQFAYVFLEGAKFALENQWIRVTDRLPEIEKDGLSIKVLVVRNKGKIHFSRYDYDMKGWISPSLDIEFTHWMLLPKLPKLWNTRNTNEQRTLPCVTYTLAIGYRCGAI